MTNEATATAAPTTKQKPAPNGDRTPIAIELLLIAHSNPHGVRLPEANGTDRILHKVIAGVEGDIETKIDFLPWMRRYRVTRQKKVGANDKVTWEPHGKPFFIPETWAVHIEADQ